MPQQNITTIDYIDSPSSCQLNFLSDGLAKEAHNQKGLLPVEYFGFFAHNASGDRLGGINGFMYYGCLYIDQLYILPSYRAQQLDTQLMDKAEELAISRGCSFSTVSTMDWEAEEFYIKTGYYKEFERKGYDGASKMIFLRKDFDKHR